MEPRADLACQVKLPTVRSLRLALLLLTATWPPIFPLAANIQRITTGDDHASEKFHLRNPPAGEVTALAIDPEDSRSLYLALENEIWTSVDRGASWWPSATLAGRVSGLW